MDPEHLQIIWVLIIVGAIVLGVVKSFLRVFVKPFAGTPPGGGAPADGEAPVSRRGKDLKEFIDELRRDLGHGETPPPRTDGLLDEKEDRNDQYEWRDFPVEGAGRPQPAPRPPASALPLPPQRPMPRPRLEDRGTESDRELEMLRDRARTRMAAKALGAGRPPAGEARARPTVREPSAQTIAENKVETEREASDLLASTIHHEKRTGTTKILGIDIQAAVIIAEVLGPPRCRRRHHRPGH